MVVPCKLVRVLEGAPERVPPVWLMRQAGRYLPEYRAVREKAGSFWGLALNPELAAEVTVQPIRRFGFDAAILFSDILTVPLALGHNVIFTEGEGPSMAPIAGTQGFDRDPEHWDTRFAPVYQTLQLCREKLSGEGFADTALLGFAGAPWTLATYLAAGRGGDEQAAAKSWAYRDPAGFAALLDVLADCVEFHLVRQLRAPQYGRNRAAPRGKTELEAAAFTAATDFPRQALHAFVLGFQHPSLHKTMRFETPWPADFTALVGALRNLNTR